MNTVNHTSNRSSLTLFIESLQKENVSPRTVSAYRLDVLKFLRYFQVGPTDFDVTYLESLRVEHFESYFRRPNGKPFNFDTLKRNVAAIRRFYRFLLDSGLLKHNPAEHLSIRSVLTGPLASQSIQNAFSYLNSPHVNTTEGDNIRHRRDELMLLLMIFYGVRQSELPGLRLSSIKRSGGRVVLEIHAERRIQPGPRLLARLRWYLSNRKFNSDILFLRHPKNLRVNHPTFQTLFVELNIGAGARCSAKSLYETFLQLRQDPDKRQKLLDEILSSRNPDK